ncbi:MAG TPA: nucleotidyltransferase domain-containing protein [Methanothrix sp.]|mgnify:CR=1 FL=1|nr:nucleotidyltransferase domain-containing protein [Methanothrix sp.]HPT19552.1 nucleotidyltransferase domain-containing protein [Methanothrix sp.]
MLTELFKTEERAIILHYVMFRKSFRAVDVSRDTGVTKGLVSRYMHILEVHGLLKKRGREYSPQDGPRSRAIRLLLNLERIDLSTFSLGSARGIGIYGSWARGTNDQESDLDVWIKADSLPEQNILARLQRDLSLQTGSEVNLLMLTPERLERLKIEDPPFYHSLMMNCVTLKGEMLEEYR